MTTMVTIVDYGCGNLFSVARAVERAGGRPAFASNPDDIKKAQLLVLPGVGAFEEGMKGLLVRDLIGPIREYSDSGRPLLGICLGMQMLATSSEEFGEHGGLNLIPGRVLPLPKLDVTGKAQKIPNVSWEDIRSVNEVQWGDTLLEPLLKTRGSVYFVHSYHMVPDSYHARIAEYNFGGHQIVAAVRLNNVTGCQFHPEKSGEVGLSIITKFLSV